MSPDQIFLLSLLAAVLVLFVWGRWRYDVVAIGAMLLVAITGIVPVQDVFLGFGHPATLTVAMVLIISRGLLNSGVIDLMAEHVLRPLKSTTGQIGLMSLVAAGLSAVMNNVGALALLMPAAIRSAANAKRPPAAILMPLSFASILGGMLTLIGTPPNIIIAAIRLQTSGSAFGMFDFTPVGGVVALTGVLFVSVVGWRLIPKKRRARLSAAELFKIEDYVTEAVVPDGSGLVGRRLSEVDNEADEKDADLLGVVRSERRLDMRAGGRTFQVGDVLLLEAAPEALERLLKDWGLEAVGADNHKEQAAGLTLAEAVVPSRSSLLGRTAAALRLRRRYDVNLVAVSRASEPFRGRLRSFRFRTGDVVLLEGDAENLPEAIAELGLLPLAERDLRVGRPRRALLASGLFVLAITLASLGVLSLTVALGSAALAMILVGLVPVREMYDHVDWPVIVLLGAMIPVGQALEVSGTTQMIASGLVAVSAGLSPVVLLTVILVVTMTLSDVINNAATAVVMAPIALTIAHELGVNPDAFLMAVAVGASSAFLTPIGHQNNALILGPGGYRFGDYWRMGLPLEVLIVLVAIPMLLIVWPL
ncbi:MAG: SLC13 family permease [Candidatus Krumholzibacteria bacterium]|nr:SLC13 family permease [Candidatus Krumholzibacteria bacterium]